MRVLYLGFSDDLGHCLGVGRKLRGQITHLRKIGVEAHGYLLHLAGSGKNAQPAEVGPEVEFVGVAPPPANSRFYQMKKRKSYFQAVEEIVRKAPFDLIYFRYPFADLELLRFVRRFPGQVVFEHQTIEPAEIRLRSGRGLSYWSESILAPFVLHYAGGSVGVTRQIAAFEKQRVFRNPDYPVETVSNGYDVESVSRRTPPPFDGRSVRILVVANFAAWHGLDRLIQGLAEYRGDVDIKLDVVGDGAILAECRQAIVHAGLEAKVTFHGKLYGDSLDAVYDQCHLATGSLGLHRIGMTEASTLKVRECWARGIPFLLTYEDTDHLQSKGMSSYYWCGAMDDSPIPMNQVVDFARSVLANPNHAEQMREIARTTVDMGVKMKRLKEFLENVA